MECPAPVEASIIQPLLIKFRKHGENGDGKTARARELECLLQMMSSYKNK